MMGLNPLRLQSLKRELSKRLLLHLTGDLPVARAWFSKSRPCCISAFFHPPQKSTDQGGPGAVRREAVTFLKS